MGSPPPGWRIYHFPTFYPFALSPAVAASLVFKRGGVSRIKMPRRCCMDVCEVPFGEWRGLLDYHARNKTHLTKRCPYHALVLSVAQSMVTSLISFGPNAVSEIYATVARFQSPCHQRAGHFHKQGHVAKSPLKSRWKPMSRTHTVHHRKKSSNVAYTKNPLPD